MATLGEKLAKSLVILQELQDKNNSIAIKTSEINRTHRERLLKNGFLQEVAKGWYIVVYPQGNEVGSTLWYTSYWQFCARYLSDKYGNDYCISAEQSILMHAGNNAIPQQLIIRAPKAPNKNISLLFKTSLFEMKDM